MPEATAPELAKAAGVSRARIYQMANEGMPGKLRRGKWDPDVALAWIADKRADAETMHGILSGPDANNATTATLVEMRTRLTRLQCDAQELRNGILSGDLILRDSAQRIYSGMIAEQIAVGDRWVAMGRTGEEQATRRTMWHELRDQLHGSVERVAAAFERGEDVAATRVRLR